MLCLSRRTNEIVYIGEDIKVQILNIKGNQVRIGIDAPKDILIIREELMEADQDVQTCAD